MDEVSRTSDLVRRGAVYYCRRRCPQHLRRENVPAEKWLSLRTTDRRQAIERLDAARREIDEFFRAGYQPAPSGIVATTARLRRPDHPDLPVLGEEEVTPLARKFFRAAQRDLDLRSTDMLVLDAETRAEWFRELEDEWGRLNHLSDDEEHPADGAEIATLRGAGRRCSYDSAAATLLRSYLHRAMRQVKAIEIARMRGDYRDVITDSLFADPEPHAPAVERTEPLPAARTNTGLGAVVDAWAREGAVAPKGIDAHRAVVRWFHERVGDLSVEEMTHREVRLFKDTLVKEGVTPANVNTKLQRLRTLLQFAVASGHIPANPATGISVRDKDAARRKPREFDLASLNAIFSSPVYADDVRPTQGRGEAAYWLPLLGLFTGARLEELAQLRPLDVAQERYIGAADEDRVTWVIRIVQDEEDGLKTKNAGSERRVPVHAELERLGFLRFAQAAIEAGQSRLFPLLKANIYGRYGAKWGEWWSRYRRDVCMVTDRRMVFHSFRHTFKYQARHVGMIEGVQRQIMGHSPGDTADSYGPGGYSLHQLVEGMRLYRVPGLLLPAPPPMFRQASAGDSREMRRSGDPAPPLQRVAADALQSSMK